jgi:predicted nucleotidyltransferase
LITYGWAFDLHLIATKHPISHHPSLPWHHFARSRDARACAFYHRRVSREQSTAAIERFRVSCTDHPLVVAAFLGGSYAAGRARPDSDIDLYLVTRPEDYSTFIADRQRFIRTWGDPTQLEDIWNFVGLGFDMTAFKMTDGVHGEIAYGTTANFLILHRGPHEVLVDKAGLLDGVIFPLL